MPSTLSQFRKHQKILMVVATGLSMISFVILGAARSSREMPAPLMVIALAAMFGGAAWVIGQVNGKSSEYSTVGAVAGAVLGLWLSWGRSDPAAILMDSGDLTNRQVFEMKRERNLANQFVTDAYTRSNGFSPMFAEQFGQRVLFRYTPGQYDSDIDMAITELLRREADRLGISVSTASVFDFIRGLAMTSSKSLTSEQFAEIRTRLGVSEEHLIDILAHELKARRAYDLLYNQRPMPTPEALYEYYKKLNLTEEADVAILPVADFVDAKAEPSKAELEELFAKYKANPPGVGPDGKFEEGRPGFRQPPRMTLAYLEATYDTFEKQAGEVTDKEIEERYERLKSRPFGGELEAPKFPGEEMPKIPPGGLPNALEGVLPGSLKAPAPPSIDGSAPPAKTEEGKKPESSAPAAPAPPVPAPGADAPKAEAPKADAPKADAPPAAAPEKKPEEAVPAEKPADKPSTMLPNLSKLSFVSFQETQEADDRPPAPPTATGASTPALPPPTIEGVAPPAEPALPTVRPLDDAYRAELKAEILRERTQAIMEKKIEEATQWVAAEVGSKINTPVTEAGHITAEEAAKKLKEYASKNGLVYVETPFVSFQELSTSEDYPVGKAAAINHPEKANVATDAFESFGRSMFYLPRPAASLDERGEGSRFVYWLTGERRDGEPQNMDDPIVKEQVVKTWRNLKAREKAEARAAELLKTAKGSDKSLVDLFAETSVTGTSEGYISVRPTGKFSWYRMPVVPTRSMQREASPTITDLPGFKPLGDAFFTTVFEKMKPGELATTWSADKSEYYVVKLTGRTPSTPEELETFRQTFLSRGLANEYFDLASRDWQQHGRNPIDDLLKRNNVQIVNRREDGSPEG
ncbi:MAG TPA: hypothetical protein VM510_10860 [Caulifigura sp.]|nr:hypothetical protein [Caulifigura sp.]